MGVRYNTVYGFRARFARGAPFTILREEYAGRVDLAGIRQQVKNAARRYAPGRRCRIKVTEGGDLVVQVEDRTRRGAHAGRAA